jgi:hypothetical protein
MTCQACGAKTHNHLCNPCTEDTRNLLVELVIGPDHNGHSSPGLLAYLRDTAIGAIRAGEPLPIAHRTPTAGRSGNPTALQLLSTIHTTMARIAASLPTKDAIVCNGVNLVDAAFIGPLRPNQRRKPASAYTPTTEELTIWLAGHTHTIATQTTAGHTRRQLRALHHRIIATIDRPHRHYAGPCDCGQRLSAPADDTTVTCPNCGIIHNIEDLHKDQIRAAINTGHAFTANEFPVAMAMLGNPISERTWRRWRATGRLPIAGYRDNQPLYQMPRTDARSEVLHRQSYQRQAP